MTFKWMRTGAATLALALAPMAVQAADYPIKEVYPKMPYTKAPSYKAPLRSVVAYHNWTGAYAGIAGGYGWGGSVWDSPVGTSNTPTGALFGGTLGYNYQIGSFVWGVEGDLSWSGIKGTGTCGLFECETRNQFLGTVRGRFGYAFDRTMPYLTAGMSIGDIKTSTSNPLVTGGSKTNMGFVVGAGIEHALWGPWSTKFEYLYADLGKFDCGTCVAGVLSNNVSFTTNIVRVGLNYKFSSPLSSKW